MLWLKSPKNAIEGVWHLKSLNINGADSALNDNVKMYREKGLRFTSKNGIDNYEQYVGGTWTLIDKKKQIFLRLVRQIPELNGYQFPIQKNLFIEENGMNWRIEKLTKKEFWLSTTNNNISYEIHLLNE